MKIELRNVKYAAFASQETACFSASVYIDDVMAGTASNDGHGGINKIEPAALRQTLIAHAGTLPPDCGISMTADFFVSTLVSDWLIARDMKRAMAKRIIYTKAGTKGVFQTKPLKADQMTVLLEDAQLPLKLTAERILNLLPVDEMVALVKANA